MSIRLIHSRRCWTGGALRDATVEIRDGKIRAVHEGPVSGADYFDAGDDVLMPGVIDAHVHVNEPGRADWEGWETATKAAAAGGITTLVEMPLNASPVTTSAEALELKKQSTVGKLHTNVGFYGGLVPGNAGNMNALADAGVLGIKAFLTHSGIDEFPNVTVNDLETAMPVLAQQQLPLLVHCELDQPGLDARLKAAPASYRAYLASRPPDWEDRAIAMMIGLCRRFDCPVHIVHVASAGAIGMIRSAKAEGLPLTAESCPHYLLFSAEEIPDGQTVYKCAPPIRDRNNNEELKRALAEGVLDFIATDHSPAPPALKELENGNLARAWGGIAGLQYLLPAAWTALREQLSLERFIPLLTERPARFLGLQHRKGSIAAGQDADLVVWNPEQTFIPTAATVLHRHKISPYLDRQLYGTVSATFISGNTAWMNGQVDTKKHGQWLLKK